MKLRHGFVNSPKILNVPDFGGHHREDVRVVHNPASTWMHNEAGAASVGCIVEQYNQANYETHTHISFWGGPALWSFQHHTISLIYF